MLLMFSISPLFTLAKRTFQIFSFSCQSRCLVYERLKIFWNIIFLMFINHFFILPFWKKNILFTIFTMCKVVFLATYIHSNFKKSLFTRLYLLTIYKKKHSFIRKNNLLLNFLRSRFVVLISTYTRPKSHLI